MVTVFCWDGRLYGVNMYQVAINGGLIELETGEVVECVDGWTETDPPYPCGMRGAPANVIEKAIAVKAREIKEQNIFDPVKEYEEADKLRNGSGS